MCTRSRIMLNNTRGGEKMNETTAISLAGLLPFMLIGIPFAIGNYFLAKRIGTNEIIWVILSILPIINLIFMYYVVYKTVYAILDRLNSK